jgi:hypothetical protein
MTKLNINQTQITLPDVIKWIGQKGFPENSLDNAVLTGSLDSAGIYYSLLRWHPGYMSAPHSYITDRLCIVVSGVWWVNSGPDFDPANCVPTPAGSFIKRVANTPHYDGVLANGTQPAVIAICGMAPVGVKLLEPGKPGWRRV